MSDAIVKGNFAITNQKYNCPRHGAVEQVITSRITGHEGHWCIICLIEMLDRNNVPRIKPLTTEGP